MAKKGENYCQNLVIGLNLPIQLSLAGAPPARLNEE